jgi:ATP-dependent RNA helicase DDX41
MPALIESLLAYFKFSVLDERGCAYCGGLGHRITDCPKLEAKQIKETGNIGRKDYLAPGAADW